MKKDFPFKDKCNSSKLCPFTNSFSPFSCLCLFVPYQVPSNSSKLLELSRKADHKNLPLPLSLPLFPCRGLGAPRHPSVIIDLKWTSRFWERRPWSRWVTKLYLSHFLPKTGGQLLKSGKKKQRFSPNAEVPRDNVWAWCSAWPGEFLRLRNRELAEMKKPLSNGEKDSRPLIAWLIKSWMKFIAGEWVVQLIPKKVEVFSLANLNRQVLALLIELKRKRKKLFEFKKHVMAVFSIFQKRKCESCVFL